MAVVVLAVVIFNLDNLREEESVFLTEPSGIACFKKSCSTLVENLENENLWHRVFI